MPTPKEPQAVSGLELFVAHGEIIDAVVVRADRFPPNA